MASSFYSNSQHVDFDSVLAMDDQAVIYEAALVDFFENASVREGVIISTVAGQLVEISEEWFAESFELPVDGLGYLSEISKDVIFDARSIVSLSGESSEFPASKILTDKTVHRFVSLNDKAGAEEATGAPKPKAASKKRLAADVGAAAVPIQMVEASAGVLTAEQPATEEGISADQPVEVGVEEVAAEIDASADRDKPADTNEERQWFDLSHEELIAKWAAERIVTSPADTDEEIEVEKPVFKSVEAVESVIEVEEAAADKDFFIVDDPYTVINQVLHQLDSISADKDDKSGTRAETWFDSALDEMLRNDKGAETMDVGTTGGDQQVQCSEEEPVVQKTNDDLLDADEQKLLEDILLTIPVDVPLPSAGMEITKIVMGKEIKIPEVTERTWFLNSLPKIPAENKGKAILVEKDPMKGNPA
ncbi:hypothetical protein F511_41784 [Dorcoceras hygrometricum]|uniref:Uncharacterized protein n=1 Tax=Dorcoceras hygrometricum TaxID=472368 RepID=A0A2Z7CC77_9LAMI|nr:hypothetical protein F511_41784 [Dorcoceras hygrometricum]